MGYTPEQKLNNLGIHNVEELWTDEGVYVVKKINEIIEVLNALVYLVEEDNRYKR